MLETHSSPWTRWTQILDQWKWRQGHVEFVDVCQLDSGARMFDFAICRPVDSHFVGLLVHVVSALAC